MIILIYYTYLISLFLLGLYVSSVLMLGLFFVRINEGRAVEHKAINEVSNLIAKTQNILVFSLILCFLYFANYIPYNELNYSYRIIYPSFFFNTKGVILFRLSHFNTWSEYSCVKGLDPQSCFLEVDQYIKSQELTLK